MVKKKNEIKTNNNKFMKIFWMLKKQEFNNLKYVLGLFIIVLGAFMICMIQSKGHQFFGWPGFVIGTIILFIVVNIISTYILNKFNDYEYSSFIDNLRFHSYINLFIVAFITLLNLMSIFFNT